ncbi:hypothetical protein [Pseudomonas yamanorum]
MTTHKRNKSKGTFTVTKSVHGPLTFTNAFLRERTADTLLVGARIFLNDEETLQITLGLPTVNGESSGDLGPVPERVPFAYFDHYKKDEHIYYDAEKGKFKMTLIKQVEHVTGEFHFVSQEVKFEGEFNVYYFEL